MSKQQVAIKEQTAPLAPQAAEPDYIALAIERNLPPEIFSKLIDNAERVAAIRARKAFDTAMAGAKAEMPKILKNREVDFTSQKGRTNYKYEDFAGVAAQVDPVLTRHGLSYRFRTNSDKDHISVTCIVSHREGHSEENTLTAPNDHTGNKNAIQAIGSTQTYLQRYTLKAALGLAASADGDANSASPEAAPPETIMPDQVAEIEKIITACGARADTVRKAALNKYGITDFADLYVRDYPSLIKKLSATAKESQQ